MWVYVCLGRGNSATVEAIPAGDFGMQLLARPEDEGEVLLFRPGLRAFRGSLAALHRLCREGLVEVPGRTPIEVSLCAWRCGPAAGSAEAGREAEWQVAAVNRCLAEGAAPADSGIRVRLADMRDAPGLALDSPASLDCATPLHPMSAEPHIVDIYLHSHPWTARACPIHRRIFLGLPRLERFTLAHEIAHLLGMPQRAHVDDNPYLRRGNVMDTTPIGGRGDLTVGQACIFNLHVESFAARLRANRESRFPLRRCIDEHAEPVKGPSLGLHFPAG